MTNQFGETTATTSTNSEPPVATPSPTPATKKVQLSDAGDVPMAGKAEEPASLGMWKELIGLVVRSILWEEVDKFEQNPGKSTPEEAQLMKGVREKLITEGLRYISSELHMDKIQSMIAEENNNSRKRKFGKEDNDSDCISGPPNIVKVNSRESSKKLKKDNAEKLSDKGELAAKTSHQEKTR